MIVEERKLDEMPFDHSFEVEEGRTELCQATGIEVRFEGDDTWWNEYKDSAGDYHYGR